MELYFLNYDLDYNFGRRFKEPYYLFTNEYSLLEDKCRLVEAPSSTPYIYSAKFGNLKLLQIDDKKIKKLFVREGYSENFDSNDLYTYLENFELSEDELFNDYPEIEFFDVLKEELEIDGITDCPIYDPEIGAYAPWGVIIFDPAKKIKSVKNESKENFEKFIKYLGDTLDDSESITLEIDDPEYIDKGYDEILILPSGVYYLYNYAKDYYKESFMDYLQENDEKLFNQILRNNKIYDSLEDIEIAFNQYNEDHKETITDTLCYDFDRAYELEISDYYTPLDDQ